MEHYYPDTTDYQNGRDYTIDDDGYAFTDAHSRHAVSLQLDHVSDDQIIRQFSEAGSMHVDEGPAESTQNRTRQSVASDHIKHSRVRSGCLTCRKRRVKCDENRPKCQRCSKGDRECKFPDLPPLNSKVSRKAKDQKAESVPSSSGDEQHAPSFLSHDNELTKSPSGDRSPGALTPISHSGLPRQEYSISSSARVSPYQKPPTSPWADRWSELSSDIQFYLCYHRDVLCQNHYALKHDAGGFLKDHLLQIATTYDPLLYAIVAFSAYFHTMREPGNGVQVFLKYYTESLTLLRRSLTKDPDNLMGQLLTMLQLASFEEVLGDWVNALGHQKAAYRLITTSFTPETVLQSLTHRKMISWYMRFDIFAGLVAGTQTMLGREWYLALKQYYDWQAVEYPHSLSALYERTIVTARIFAMDVATHFGKKATDMVDDEDFAESLAALKRQVAEMDTMTSTRYDAHPRYVKDFPDAPADSSDDIVDATDQNYLLSGEWFTWNILKIDWWGIRLMFTSQLAQLDRSFDKTALVAQGHEICKMFQSIEYASTNKYTMIACQASMALAAAVMPNEPKYEMWFRRKFVLVESCGYIYPAALRKRMSDYWDTDVTEWWLPNGEGYSAVLRATRALNASRTNDIKNVAAEDLRDMKGVFEAMSLENRPHTEHSGSVETDLKDQIDELSAAGGTSAGRYKTNEYGHADLEQYQGGERLTAIALNEYMSNGHLR